MSQPQSPQSPGMWSRFRRVAVRAFIYTFMAVLLGFIALKEAALWAVNRQLVGRATWEDLAIAPGVVTLRGVQVWDEAGAVVATVPELRVRFALDALWRSGVPVAALTEVVLEKPRLNATIRADGRFNLLSVLRPPKEPLPPGGALDRFRGAVLVRDGQVFLKDERGAGYFASFLKVDGLVDFTGPERGSGHLYFSQPGPPDARVRLDATWRRTLRDLRATLTVDDLDLAAWTNYYVGLAGRTLPAMARGKLLRGTAWAKLLVTADGPWDEWPRTATLTGAAAFARVDGALERFAVPIRNARGQLVLTQDLLEVSGLSGLLGPNAVRASGRFFNRKDPQIDVALRLSTDDLARSLAEFGMQPRGRLGGRGELAVRFVGALARPLMDGTVKAPLLQVGGQTLRDVTGNFANVHGLWRLDGVEGRAADGVVRASGWVLGDAQNRLVLDVRTTDLALGRLLNGVEARVTADLAVLGAPADLLVTGAGDFRGLRVGALHFSDTRGAFVYGDRALFLSGVEAATQFGRLRAPFGFVDFASKRILMDLRGHGLDLAAGNGRLRGVDAALILTGTTEHPFGVGSLRAASARLDRYALQDVDALVAVSNDTLLLPRAAFTFGGTRTEASGIVAMRPVVAYDFDFWSGSASISGLMAGAGLGGFALDPGAGPLVGWVRSDGRVISVDARLRAPDGDVRVIAGGAAHAWGGIAVLDDFDAVLLRRVGLGAVHPMGRLDATAVFAARDGGGYDFDLLGTSSSLSVGGLPFRAFSVGGAWHGGVADVDSFMMSGPAGDLAAFGRLPVSGGAWDLRWRAEHLDLARLARSLRVGRHPNAARKALARASLSDLEGWLDASGTVKGVGANPLVRGEARIDEALLHRETLWARVPFRATRELVTLDDSRFRLGPDLVRIDGQVGLTGSLHLAARTGRLELRRALAFTGFADPRAQGWLDANLMVAGSLDNPLVSGNLALHRAVVRGQPIDEARVRLVAEHGRINVGELVARIGAGTVRGRGTVRPGGAIDMELQARNFPAAAISALPEGVGDVDLHVGGTTANPTFAGKVDLRGLKTTSGQVIGLRGEARWVSPDLLFDNLAVVGPDGAWTAAASGSLRLPSGVLPRTFDELIGRDPAIADLRLDFSRAEVAALLGLASPSYAGMLAGTLNGSMTVKGPLNRPRVAGEVSGSGMRVRKVDVGIATASFEWDMAGNGLDLLDLHLEGPAGLVDLVAGLRGGANNVVRLYTEGFDLAALAPFVPGNFPFSGKMDSSLMLSGPLEAPKIGGAFSITNGVLAQMDFDTFTGGVSGDDGTYRLNDFLLTVQSHRARLSGIIPVRLEKGVFMFPAPMSVRGGYEEDSLNVLSLFVPGMQPSKGRVALTFEAGGTYPDITWHGDVRVSNGIIRNDRLGQPLEDLQLHATLEERRFQIERFTGRLGKGVFEVQGGADLKGFSLADVNVTLSGTDLSVIIKPYLSSVLDVHLHLSGASPEPVLSGEIKGKSVDFTLPISELGSSLAGGSAAAGTGAQGEPPPAPKDDTPPPTTEEQAAGSPFHLLPRVRFSVGVALGSGAWLRFLQSTIRAEGDVDILGTWPGALVPAGVVEFKQGLIQIPLFPTALRIASGKAYFNGSGGWMPDLEVSAVGNVNEYEIYVDVTGPANDPHVRMTSNPPLPQANIQQLLVFGTTSRGPTGLPQPVTSPGALNALVSVAQANFLSPITSAFGKLFALSEVTFELSQTGAVQLKFTKALDPRQHFLLTFATLQGNNIQSLPTSVYGFEWRFAPNQLVRISNNNLGGLSFFYQARWQFEINWSRKAPPSPSPTGDKTGR